MIDRYGAFVDLAEEEAEPGEGALAGLRIGIKANIAVAGLPWTGGMKLFAARIAGEDAEVVARLRGAGAVIAGSLNMHEAALGATTDNPWFGRTINPHRAGFTPGGSSGGSGAAVAAGLVDAALGTDTLGSVRIPASYCGIYGLKPTIGAVPTNGLMFLDRRFDCIGPLARDLETLERLWRVIGPGETGEIRLKRLVTWRDFGGVEVQPAIRAAFERARELIGLSVEEIDFAVDPSTVRLAALTGIARALIADLGPRRTEQRDSISPELHFIMNALEAMPDRPETVAGVRDGLIARLGDDGVMLLPTTPQVAFAHGGAAPHSQADFTAPASIAGLPALSLPAGTDADGLPIGLQLIGPAGSEAALMALARTLWPALGGSIALPEEKP